MKTGNLFKISMHLFMAILVFGSCKSSEPGIASKRYKNLLEQNRQLKTELENLKNQEKQPSTDEAALNLTHLIASGLPEFSSDEVTIEVRNGRVYVSMSDKLLFRSGSARVEDKGRVAVSSLAEVMREYPLIEILVEGHTDAIPVKSGPYKDNWELSVARAISITRILVEGKVNPERITASGKSEYYPVAPNNTVEGRAKNRRTEIILIPVQSEF